MKHRHAELIKSWADGAEVQYKNDFGEWWDANNPLWSEDVDYRIKPDPFIQKMIDAYKSGYKIKYRLNTKYASKWYDLDFVNPKDIETYNFDQLTYKWSIDPEEYTGSPYRQYIEAEKAGKQIQYRYKAFSTTTYGWEDKKVGMVFDSKCEYRIKPNDTEYKFIFRYNNPSNDIEDILDCFDFNKVKQVMDFLNWEWSFEGVPELWDLRKQARSLLKKVAEKIQTCDRDNYYVATGGFRAEANIYEDDPKIYLRLVFELSDWDNFE